MSEAQEAIQSARLVNYIESEAGADESGPFYLYSPGEDFYRLNDVTHGHKDGLKQVLAGKAAFLDKAKPWYGAEQVPEGAEQRKRQILDERRRVTDRFSQIHIAPSANRDRLLDMYRTRGMVEIKEFAGSDEETINLSTFNALIAPLPVKLSEVLNPELIEAIERNGALNVRREQVRTALKVLKTGKLDEQLGSLTATYIAAIEKSILPAFESYRVSAGLYLDSQEVEIKKNRKAYYDERDVMIMWLLGRKPKDEALSRSLEGQSGGLDAAAIKQLVESVVEAKGTTGESAPATGIETMQCPECGSVINMVAGGPPRICLHCKFRFDSPPQEEVKPAKGKAK